VADEPADVSDALLTAITTEHFTLQGARSATISDGASRTTLFLGATSSGLIALGFVADDRRTFVALAVPVLLTLVVLGLLTCARLVQGSVEDLRYGRAINRLRAVYRELAGTRADELFLLEASGDVGGVLRNMGVTRPGVRQLALTNATAVAVVTAVLAGALTAVVAGPALGASTGAAVAAGGAVLGIALVGLLAWQTAVHRRGDDRPSARWGADALG